LPAASFERLLRRKFDIAGYLVWSGWQVRSALGVVRIEPIPPTPASGLTQIG
jgi:hypothetical protein